MNKESIEEEKRRLKKEYDVKYRKKNHEKIVLQCRLWRKNNKEKHKQSNKEYIRKNYIHHKLSQARNRIVKRGLEFSITIEDIEKLILKQDNKCRYSNIIFDPENKNYSMSIDRINSNLGYTNDNIQLICSVINMMKNNLKEEEFLYIIKKIYAHI